MTIPKSMFERELDYYGVSAERDSITAETVLTFAESLTSECRHTKEKHEAAIEKRYAFLLAMESHRQFLLAENGIRSKDYIQIEGNDDLHKKDHIFSSRGRELVVKYLGEFFGLEIDPSTHSCDEDFPMLSYPPNLCGYIFRVRKKETQKSSMLSS